MKNKKYFGFCVGMVLNDDLGNIYILKRINKNSLILDNGVNILNSKKDNINNLTFLV